MPRWQGMKHLLKTLIFVTVLGAFVTSLGHGRAAVDRISSFDTSYSNNWHEKYDPDHAYYNDGYELVNIRAKPAIGSNVVGLIKPLEGGFVKTCDEDNKWCYVDFGGKPHAGWVKMSALEESVIQYGE